MQSSCELLSDCIFEMLKTANQKFIADYGEL